mmetsp:Transcript_65782/g.195773  ORF Transcript_65782/g.195773 Transcript_65782/m.195773 type:complete len:241 (+) Transcript_65782:114-836(+)
MSSVGCKATSTSSSGGSRDSIASGKRKSRWGFRKPAARRNGWPESRRFWAARRSFTTASSAITLSQSCLVVRGWRTMPSAVASTGQSLPGPILQPHIQATSLTLSMESPSLQLGGSSFGGMPGPFLVGSSLPAAPSSVWKIFPEESVSQPFLLKCCGSEVQEARVLKVPRRPQTAPSSRKMLPGLALSWQVRFAWVYVHALQPSSSAQMEQHCPLPPQGASPPHSHPKIFTSRSVGPAYA